MRTFLMENALETGRFQAHFNAGESGGPALTLGEVIELFAAEHNDLNSSKKEQLVTELTHLSLSDSPNHGRHDLREHIARLHQGACVPNTLVTTGTSEALFLLFQVLKPKSVAVLLPGFQLLTEIARAVRAKIIPLQITWNEKMEPIANEELFLELLRKEKPEVILFNHPHNPSGYVFSNSFLTALQELAQEIQARIVGDEHYRFLTTNETAMQTKHDLSPVHHLGDTLYRNDQRTVVTGSFIKCLGTPGLRIGWCVGPETIIAKMQSLKNYTTHTVNPLSEWIAEHLLREPALFCFSEQRKTWEDNKNTLREWKRRQDLSETRWRTSVPNGGWVTVLSRTDFPQKKKKTDAWLQSQSCFLLDLKLMELAKYGSTTCSLKKQGGYRLGLGMKPAKFRKMLEVLGQI